MHNVLCRLIEQLKWIGTNAGCYKLILDCSDKSIHNKTDYYFELTCSDVRFYERCGFQKKELQMALYTKNNAKL